MIEAIREERFTRNLVSAKELLHESRIRMRDMIIVYSFSLIGVLLSYLTIKKIMLYQQVKTAKDNFVRQKKSNVEIY